MTHDICEPIHPGEVLLEEFLKPLGLSQNALALALRVPAPRINDIVRGKRGISADTALRLGRFFGTTDHFWLNLQTLFELDIARANQGQAIIRDVIPYDQSSPAAGGD